jgi:AcrR family transcriptional regulator
MKRTKKDSLLTREQLLDSALQVFLKKGYSSTTINDIVKEAGFTRGAYYWHFNSKEELLNQMLEREDQFLRKLSSNLFTIDLPALQKIEHIMLGVITNFYNNIRFQKFIEFTWFKIEQNFDDKSIIYKASANDTFIGNMDKIVTEAIRSNQVISDLSSQEISMHLISLINGIYRLFFLSPKYFKHKAKALEIVKNYLEMITIKK